MKRYIFVAFMFMVAINSTTTDEKKEEELIYRFQQNLLDFEKNVKQSPNGLTVEGTEQALEAFKKDVQNSKITCEFLLEGASSEVAQFD